MSVTLFVLILGIALKIFMVIKKINLEKQRATEELLNNLRLGSLNAGYLFVHQEDMIRQYGQQGKANEQADLRKEKIINPILGLTENKQSETE
jgi:hypothetical protein